MNKYFGVLQKPFQIISTFPRWFCKQNEPVFIQHSIKNMQMDGPFQEGWGGGFIFPTCEYVKTWSLRDFLSAPVEQEQASVLSLWERAS